MAYLPGSADFHAVRHDHEIASVAQASLRAIRYAGLRSLGCECREGVLVLSGIVSRYFLKQLAQEAVRHLQDVVLIDNQIEVVDMARSRA